MVAFLLRGSKLESKSEQLQSSLFAGRRSDLARQRDKAMAGTAGDVSAVRNAVGEWCAKR